MRKRASKLCFALVSAIARRVDGRWDVGLIQVDLLDQRGEEVFDVELQLVFPEELAAVDDAAVAQVEQVDRDERRLGVKGEDVGVITLRGGDSLLLLHFLHGGDEVAEIGGLFKAHVLGRVFHLDTKAVGEVAMAAIEEESHVADGFRIRFRRDEAFDAGSEASMDVVLQARMRMLAVEVDAARRDQEVSMDEVHQAVGQVPGEVGAEVGGPVLEEPAGDVDAREALAGQLDIGVSLVVPQKDVEAGLVLLNEVVLKAERFLLVVDLDEVDVASFADEGSGLGIAETIFVEVAADAGPEVLGLADVEHGAVCIFVEIHSGQGGQFGYFFTKLHQRTAGPGEAGSILLV
jgi:hypothetical protein